MSFPKIRCSLCCGILPTSTKCCICKCGQLVCEWCQDFQNQQCAFQKECKNKVVRACCACRNSPLCALHIISTVRICTCCENFTCEECTDVSDDKSLTGCINNIGCMFCGACNDWNKKNLQKRCDNCLKLREFNLKLQQVADNADCEYHKRIPIPQAIPNHQTK